MEKKQLDLDAPLLSVRRISSTLGASDGGYKKISEKPLPHRQHSLPSCKSDWESGEVTKPAAVPFLWEQIPGRPKDGIESEAQSPVEPGRALDDVPKLLSEEGYEDQNVFKPQIEAFPLNDSATLLESLNMGMNAEGACDSECDDDDYSDALDTLSPTETLSMKCSVSGLSGYRGSDAKPCRTFSADMQTRDFMMNRFLPAAKARVLDTPQYISKKQPVAPEQPRLVNKVVIGQRRPLLEQHRSGIFPHYGKYVEDIESEDEGDEYDYPSKTSVKACGLFSRFCLKDSLCILNPVPMMKGRTQAPTTSSSKEVNRMARTAYSGPLTQIADKHAGDAVYKKKLNSGAQSHELHKVKSKLTGESHRFYSGDLRMTYGSSPYGCFSMGGASLYHNEATPSPFREGEGFLGVTNDVENVKGIKDLSCHQRYKQVLDSMTPTVEKTLHVDCVNTVELPLTESFSSGADSLMDSCGKDFTSTVDNRRKEEPATAESFVQDVRCLNILEAESISKASGSIAADTASFAPISNLRSQADRMEDLSLDQGQDQQLRSLDCSTLHANGKLETKNERILKAEDQRNQVQQSRSLDCSRLHANGKLDRSDEVFLKADDQGSPNVSSSLSLLPPPLPKSPSESWLRRTLPPMSLRRPFSRSALGTQFHPKKTACQSFHHGYQVGDDCENFYCAS